MKNKFFCFIMLFSLIAGLVGCHEEIFKSASNQSLSYIAGSDCHETGSHQNSSTHSHEACAIYCAHNFLAAEDSALSVVQIDMAKPNWAYLFSYKNQNLDAIERPPLAA